MKRHNEMYDALLAGEEVHGTSLPTFERGITLITALSGEEEKLRIKTSWNPFPLLFTRSRSLRIADTLCDLTLPALSAASHAEGRCECQANMQRLTLALLLYEKEHGTLPTGEGPDGDWREAVKPYLGDNAEKYFQCPSARLAQNETNYAMIGDVPEYRLNSASPNQILLVEVLQPQKLGEVEGRIPFEKAKFWKGEQTPIDMECCGRVTTRMGSAPRPDDFDGLGSKHAGGINVGTRSGGIRFVSEYIAPEVWQSLLDGTATNFP
jgi:hypothetical protein